MKRRATARCAAANEDDLGSSSDTDAERIGVRRNRNTAAAERSARKLGGSVASSKVAEVDDQRNKRRRKKEKEFAWMDSEEEDEEEEDAGGAQAASAEAAEEAPEKDTREDEEVSIEALDDVQSFGRMMLLSDALQKRLHQSRLSPDEVAAACRALGRTKFFDAEILKDLDEVLWKMLSQDKLSTAQTTDAITCLWALNAYDQRVFSAVASTFRPKVALVEHSFRAIWLEVFRGFRHDIEKDFLQLLETPPLMPISPSYGKIRCRYFEKGACAVAKACTFSHDLRAPVSLEFAGPTARPSPLVMTQNQYTMGRSIYGGARNGQFS